MPTYQYRCNQCSEEFEKVQSFSDDSTPKCPGCGTRSKKNVSKIFSAVGIAFKGSGFYKNDSKSNGSGGDSKSNGSSGDSNGNKSSDSTKPSDGSTSSSSSSSSDSSSSSTTASAGASSD